MSDVRRYRPSQTLIPGEKVNPLSERFPRESTHDLLRETNAGDVSIPEEFRDTLTDDDIAVYDADTETWIPVDKTALLTFFRLTDVPDTPHYTSGYVVQANGTQLIVAQLDHGALGG